MKRVICFGDSNTFDGVHFSPEGHTAFAKGLAQALETIGQERT